MSEVTPQHDLAWARLREALFEGRLGPGQRVTVASLSADLGFGTMPVREALRRVTAEGGFTASPTRRLMVPELSPAQLLALLRARALIEPEAAAQALPFLSAADLAAMEALDAALADAIRSGDRSAYMQLNFRFHFTLYRAEPDPVLCPLIESLWLRAGPQMAQLFEHAPALQRVDRHQEALSALRLRDPQALRAAIAADIADAVLSLSPLAGAALAGPLLQAGPLGYISSDPERMRTR